MFGLVSLCYVSFILLRFVSFRPVTLRQSGFVTLHCVQLSSVGFSFVSSGVLSPVQLSFITAY